LRILAYCAACLITPIESHTCEAFKKAASPCNRKLSLICDLGENDIFRIAAKTAIASCSF
jgi:hypothetical protein